MYGIFTYIYHKNHRKVDKYIMHGWYGIGKVHKKFEFFRLKESLCPIAISCGFTTVRPGKSKVMNQPSAQQSAMENRCFCSPNRKKKVKDSFGNLLCHIAQKCTTEWNIFSTMDPEPIEITTGCKENVDNRKSMHSKMVKRWKDRY